MRIFLAADGSAGLKSARAVTRAGHTLIGVAAPKTEANTPLLNAANAGDAAIFPGIEVKDPSFANWLSENGADVLLSVHTSYVIHPAVLAAVSYGSFNLHPGPLPRYAGRNPVSWALFNRETRHAASLHWIVPEIDSGPIVSLEEVTIQHDDNALTLMAKTSTAGLIAVRNLLEGLAKGEATARVDQDMAQRRYFSARDIPLGGLPSWDFPADAIVRYFRANDFGPFPSPWPKPCLNLEGRNVVVSNVKVEDATAGVPAGTVVGSRVAASDFWLKVSTQQD